MLSLIQIFSKKHGFNQNLIKHTNNASLGVILCILVSWGTLRCPEVFSGLAIHTETKPFSVYIEIEYFMYNTQLFDAF